MFLFDRILFGFFAENFRYNIIGVFLIFIFMTKFLNIKIWVLRKIGEKNQIRICLSNWFWFKNAFEKYSVTACISQILLRNWCIGNSFWRILSISPIFCIHNWNSNCFHRNGMVLQDPRIILKRFGTDHMCLGRTKLDAVFEKFASGSVLILLSAIFFPMKRGHYWKWTS